MSKFSLAGEVWLFLRQNKKLWLLPIVAVLLLLGALLIFAQSSALAPFIYTIF
jgi:drug/metabolite transporter superfamily protein YnfA